jgi:hypothetical protein
MTAFEGDVVMVVNTASRCGFTPQYEGLQQIYDEYHAQGFDIVGVPANNFMGQEPGSSRRDPRVLHAELWRDVPDGGENGSGRRISVILSMRGLSSRSARAPCRSGISTRS